MCSKIQVRTVKIDTILKESNMAGNCLESIEKFEETGFNYTLSLINGKYKLTILYALYRLEVLRYNELRRYLGLVTHKTLSSNLKELEKDGMIIRNEYPQIPPKVEYSLSDKGKSFIQILSQMCYWGEEYR